MNILIINHYSGSEKHGMEYRPYYLGRELINEGHKVTVVAASFSHLRSKQPKIDKKIVKESIKDIKYFWLKTIAYEGNGFNRVLNMCAFAWRLFTFRKLILEESNPDVVIASSPHPFIIFGAYKIASLNKAKLVFEVRDLWPLTLVELGNISRWHPFIIFMQVAENIAYRVSDKVISLLPEAYKYMQNHGMDSNKFIYLPNGINVEEWEYNVSPLPDQHKETLLSLKNEGYFIVGYAGAHGLANALETLVDAGFKLKNEPIVFVLVGHGPEKKALQEKVQKLGISNVYFLPSIPKACIPNLLSLMDVLYIGLKKNPLFKYGISPNKLIDYLMASRPIIYAIESGNDIVEQEKCGFSISPEDSEGLATAIRRLMSLPYDEREAMGERGRDYVLNNHDYRILTQKLLRNL